MGSVMGIEGATSVLTYLAQQVKRFLHRCQVGGRPTHGLYTALRCGYMVLHHNTMRGLMYNLPFQVPENLLLLGRTLAILSGMCTGLNPNFNLWKQVGPYAAKLVDDDKAGSSFFDTILDEAGSFFKVLLDLPGRTGRRRSDRTGKQDQGRLPVQFPPLCRMAGT